MSSSPPLVAKITRPTLRDLEPRRRLFQRLDQLRHEGPAVWIAAPAGSGKTALLVSYLDELEPPVIWYRIDERDQHVAELFFYLRLAAEAQEGSPRGSLELPVFSAGVDLARFARRFFDALFLRLPPGGLLVFDDFHSSNIGSQWQAAFEKCLASVPNGVNVVVISRQSPPAPLARSLAHGELGVLESSDLLLSEQETAALAKRRMGKKQKLSEEELAQIHAVTSGWAAGVSLLLRSNQGGSLSAFSSRAVVSLFDYLTDAVFGELSETTQALLLHSACLRRFTPRELEELSGLSADRSELLSLYRSGFFLESDGPGEEVFRFHSLFRSFLSYRAEQVLGAGRVRDVRARAAGLLRRDGRGEEAFELLAQIDDQAALCELVLSHAPALFAQGRTAMLEQWITAIANDHVEASGWLSYWHANCLLTTQPTRSLARFEHALATFEREGDGTGAYLAWAGAVQALVYEQRNYQVLERWLERLTDIERVSPTFASVEVGSAVVSSLLMGLTLAGADSSVVERWITRAMTLAERASDPSLRAMAASVLVLNYSLSGDAGLAAPWLAMLERYSASGPTALLGRVAARAAETSLAWIQGRSAAAVDAAKEGLALIGENHVPMWQLALLVWGHLAAVDSGAGAEAELFLKRMAQMADSGAPLEVAGYHVARAHSEQANGQLRQALATQELALDSDRAVGFIYGQCVDLLVVGYLNSKLGDDASAREALREVHRIEEAYRHPIMRYWRLLVEADLALQTGELELAAALLGEGFAIGRERELYNMYCPAAAGVAELCRFALTRDIEPEYARTLVRRKDLFQHAPPLDLTSWPWPIQIRTCGGLEVRLDDQPLPLGRVRTPLLLLRLLLASAGQRGGVPITRVLESLWPESEGDAAMHTFDMTVLRLRNQLGEQGRRALKVERGHVLLDPAFCWTDTAALSALLAEIAVLDPETTPVATRLARCSALAARLEALYRGPFADADEATPALRGYGDRLRANVASVARALRAQLSQLGDPSRSERLAQHLREADPLLPLD